MLGADLEGKTAIVTGGGNGLGRTIVLVLAREGVRVAAADVDADAVHEVASTIEAMGESGIGITMDVRSRESVADGVAATLGAWGQIDILVNNAGVTGAPGWIHASEDRIEDWEECVAVNLFGMMHCCKAVVPHMQQRRYGKIVNISSMSGRAVSERPEDVLGGRPSHTPYAVTKAGVIRYTQKLAPALAPHNINVNTVCPGSLLTDFGLDIVRQQQVRHRPHLSSQDALAARREMVTRSNLFGRELKTEDVAKMVAFLCSDDTMNVTGAAFHVDGGGVMV
jgi:NAD(P)-dependent dehydrogenase (short-subunit alcohol dehydrogenase family)